MSAQTKYNIFKPIKYTASKLKLLSWLENIFFVYNIRSHTKLAILTHRFVWQFSIQNKPFCKWVFLCNYWVCFNFMWYNNCKLDIWVIIIITIMITMIRIPVRVMMIMLMKLRKKQSFIIYNNEEMIMILLRIILKK